MISKKRTSNNSTLFFQHSRSAFREITTQYVTFNKVFSYSHFKFDTILIDYLRQKLKAVPQRDKFSDLTSLQILTPTDDFKQLINNEFLAEEKKMKLIDKKFRKIYYKMRRHLAKVLHKVEEPYKMLETVLKFYLDEYLSPILPSLYSILHKSPEIKVNVKPYLESALWL